MDSDALLDLKRISGNIRARSDELDAAIDALMARPGGTGPDPVTPTTGRPTVGKPGNGSGLNWGRGPRSGLAPWLGLVCRKPEADELVHVEALLGERKPDFLLAEIGRDRIEHQETPSVSPKLNYAARAAQRRGIKTLLMSNPLFWDPESPLTQGPGMWIAAGQGRRNAVWKKGTADLVGFLLKHGIDHAIVRPAWESGHDEAFGHTACVCESQAEVQGYKDALCHYVDIVRAACLAAGIRCTISYSHIKSPKFRNGLGNHDLHPPLDYIDLWGLDYYGTYEPVLDEEAWERNARKTYNGGPAGIYTHLDYAKQIGKPFSIEEWGISNWKGDERKMKSGAHCGDNPYYIRRMIQFGRENREHMAYMCGYFTSHHMLGTDLSPEASAEFSRLMRA